MNYSQELIAYIRQLAGIQGLCGCQYAGHRIAAAAFSRILKKSHKGAVFNIATHLAE